MAKDNKQGVRTYIFNAEDLQPALLDIILTSDVLNKRQKGIYTAYYIDGKSQFTIAEEFGTKQSCISQTLTNINKTIDKYLKLITLTVGRAEQLSLKHYKERYNND